MVIARGEKATPPEHTSPGGVLDQKPQGLSFFRGFGLLGIVSFARSALVASAFGDSVLADSLFLDSELLVDLPESEALLLAPFSAG